MSIVSKRRAFPHVLFLFLTLWASVPSSVLAQGGTGTQMEQHQELELPCDLPAEPPGVDNRDGYQVFYEEDVVSPLALTEDGTELWALNLPDVSVQIFDLTDPTDPVLDGRIGVCAGPVSIRRRPMAPAAAATFEPIASHRQKSQAQEEMWVVCQSSNSVMIIDRGERRPTGMLETLHEPSGITFDETGARAYVTLSASNQIAEIDTSSRLVLQTIELVSPLPVNPIYGVFPVHAEQPRAVIHHADGLDVLSFKSGNGSTRNPTGPTGILSDILNAWDYYPNIFDVDPPDREVIRFDLQDPSLGSAVVWRRGTLNYDLLRLDDGRLVISTVDLENDDLIGEPEYLAKGFSEHLITITTPSSDGKPNPPITPAEKIDLNEDLDGELEGYSCAAPNEMALSADQKTLWVACYETASTAIVDLVTGKVKGFLRAAVTPAPDKPFGPRGLALNEAAGTVYVYNRGNNTVQTFSATDQTGAVDPLDIDNVGFDLTQDIIIAGRFHHINAKNSASGTVSCNTCHGDGHLDGLAWDLGAFTGNLEHDINDVAQDAKRLRVTMSLRGIEETNPFHWRGDRADLEDFNPAFEGLLGGRQLAPNEFAAFQRFIFALSYPANPNQKLDRTYRPKALRGFECFNALPSHELTFDQLGTNMTITCEDCHALDGFSGTNNQVNNDVVFDAVDEDGDGFLDDGPLAEDATQLRGMFDKESDLTWIVVQDDTGADVIEQVPATGWGFGSVSFPGTDTVQQFVALDVFDVNSVQEADITQFLDELDTGSAPTTARAVELDPADLTMVLALEKGAQDGHNDLIVRGWQETGGNTVHLGYLYDPGNDDYIPAAAAASSVPRSTLETMVGGTAQLFFIGVPVGTGYHHALDGDMDFLLDDDEVAAGGSPLSPDTDRDGYPDGYEVRFSKKPDDPTDFPAAGSDTTAPAIQNAVVAWVNSTLAKVRWDTDEESVSRVWVIDPGGNRVWFGEDLQFKKQHVMVVRNLRPSPAGGPPATYQVVIQSEDPANGAAQGNRANQAVPVSPQEHLFRSTHIPLTQVADAGPAGGGLKQVEVKFTVIDENGDPVPGARVRFSFAEWVSGSAQKATVTDDLTTGPADGFGVATAMVTTTLPAPLTVEAIARQVADDNSHRLYFHPLNGQFGFFDQLDLTP